MELKDLENLEVNINTKQTFEVINVINKLGLKEQVKDAMFGTVEMNSVKKTLLIKEEKYKALIMDLIETKMDYEEYEKLEQDEKNKILNEVLTNDAIKMGNELNQIINELNELAKIGGFDLFYTAIFERLYGNQEVVFKALANIYSVKAKEIEKQDPDVTFLMVKKIWECKQLKNLMKVFL